MSVAEAGCWEELTLGRMLETEIGDGSEELRLEEEVTETCRVDTDVGTLLSVKNVCCKQRTMSVGEANVVSDMDKVSMVLRQRERSDIVSRCRWVDSGRAE